MDFIKSFPKTLFIEKQPNAIRTVLGTKTSTDVNIYPLTMLHYHEQEGFKDIVVNTIETNYEDSLIFFYNEKKSVDLFVRILKMMDPKKGLIVQKDKRYYIKIVDNIDSVILNNNIVRTHDLLFYFTEILNSF